MILRGQIAYLYKPFAEFHMTGVGYEVANVLDEFVILRDMKNKCAAGAIPINDFFDHFRVHRSGWTDWDRAITDVGAILYRTNYKKVQVKMLYENEYVTGEACCNKTDTFKLTKGILIAHFRCLEKINYFKTTKLEDKLNALNQEKNMIKTRLKELT